MREEKKEKKKREKKDKKKNLQGLCIVSRTFNNIFNASLYSLDSYSFGNTVRLSLTA
jgi:hypothetical protein